MSSKKSSKRALAIAALCGFSLTYVTKARASPLVGAMVSATSGWVTTFGAVVVAVAFLVKRFNNNHGTASLEPGQLTRHMVDSGLIGVRGDFGMELGLLIESPSAFDQLTTEARTGKGAILSSLSQSTNIPTDSLAGYWMNAVDEVGVTANKSIGNSKPFLRAWRPLSASLRGASQGSKVPGSSPHQL